MDTKPKEVVGDIWKLFDSKHTIVIPTNGTMTKEKQIVMGRGLAAEVVKMYPTIQHELWKRIVLDGNHVYHFVQWRLFTFPVKDQWFETADLSLIQQSCIELQQSIISSKLKHVLLPRVGCGNGGLCWDKVKPVVKRLLDQRCTIVTWEKEIA